MKGDSFGAELYIDHTIVQYFNCLIFEQLKGYLAVNDIAQWFSCYLNNAKLCAQKIAKS